MALEQVKQLLVLLIKRWKLILKGKEDVHIETKLFL